MVTGVQTCALPISASDLEQFKKHLLNLLKEEVNTTIADILKIIEDSPYTSPRYKEVFNMSVSDVNRKEEAQLLIDSLELKEKCFKK